MKSQQYNEPVLTVHTFQTFNSSTTLLSLLTVADVVAYPIDGNQSDCQEIFKWEQGTVLNKILDYIKLVYHALPSDFEVYVDLLAHTVLSSDLN